MAAIEETTEFDPALFDEVIDVRSEGEFEEDHIPGAINLPVLDNAERARVGTIYVQEDPFLARKIGAALAARNIARHVETHFADKPGGYRPMIHCWRGGQRSRSMALVLSQIGWRVSLLQGGYKRYRRSVTERLYHAEPWFRTVLLEGMTGVGKTDILARLGALGAPTLDLEELAAHRGSLFGAMPGRTAPSQKSFESAVLAGLPAFTETATISDASPMLFLEAEASRVGDRAVPPTLWKGMSLGAVVEISAPLAERVRYTARRYADIAADREQLIAVLWSLRQRHGRARAEEWIALAEAGEIEPLIERLMVEHYDPAYARAAQKRAAPYARIALPRLDEAAFEEAAAEVLSLAPTLEPIEA